MHAYVCRRNYRAAKLDPPPDMLNGIIKIGNYFFSQVGIMLPSYVSIMVIQQASCYLVSRDETSIN